MTRNLTSLAALVAVLVLVGCRAAVPPARQARTVVSAPQTPANGTAHRGGEAVTSAPGTPATGLTGTLAVGVPCGLAMAYKEVRSQFLKQNPGLKFRDHVKNIGPMTKEVRDGKVALDVFLSLGDREIESLTQAGMIAGKPTPFLRQSMQLLVCRGNPLRIKRLEDLAKPGVRTVAVCDPMLTLGHAGEEALRKVGVWEKLVTEDKLIRPGQPQQAKEAVIAGKADATFIYAACSSANWREGDPERSVAGKAVVVMTVPEALYGGMFAVAAVLTTASDPKLAQAFVDFLRTPEAQEAVTKWGYGKLNAGGVESKHPPSGAKSLPPREAH